MNIFEDTTDRESSLAEIKRSIRTAALARRKAIPEAERIARSANICDALIEKLDGLLRAQSTPSAAPYTVAVYCAIASEVSLGRFIDYAYERGCRMCFPCMEEVAPAQSANRSQGDHRDDHLGDRSEDRPEDRSGNRPDNCRDNYPDVLPDDHPETNMTFRDVSAEAFARKEARFLTHPTRAYRTDDPELSAFPLVASQDIDLAIIPLVAFDMSGNRLGYGKGNYDRFLPTLAPTAQLVGVAFAEQQVDTLPCESFDKPLPEIIAR